MGRPRGFDWDQAKRLRDAGFTVSEIADQLGVATMSVYRSLDPVLRERIATRQRNRRAWIGACIDCGGPASIAKASGGSSRNGRCRECANKAAAVSVRPDTLRCSGCRYWLPDDDFPHAVALKARRGRHAMCRPCQNVARQLNRLANRERERAYDHARRARSAS